MQIDHWVQLLVNLLILICIVSQLYFPPLPRPPRPCRLRQMLLPLNQTSQRLKSNRGLTIHVNPQNLSYYNVIIHFVLLFHCFPPILLFMFNSILRCLFSMFLIQVPHTNCLRLIPYRSRLAKQARLLKGEAFASSD